MTAPPVVSPDAATEILRARARSLARPPDRAPAPETLLEVLEFRLAEEHYGVETRFVTEVHPLKDLTPLPGTPSFVRGIVNVRGRILAVLDLKKFLNLPDPGLTDLHCLLLVRGGDLEFGLLADVVVGVRSIPKASLQPTLPTVTGIHADYLQGVTAERLVVLDLGRMLSDPRIVVHEAVES